VIAARQLNIKVLGICWVSNFTSCVIKSKVEHSEVLELGAKVSVKMKALIERMLGSKNI